MVSLTNEQRDMLHQAIVGAFTNFDLEQLQFDPEVDLRRLAPDSLDRLVFDLLTWCEQHNRLDKFLTAIARARPSNAEVQEAVFETGVALRLARQKQARQRQLEAVSPRAGFWAVAALRWTADLATVARFPATDPAAVFALLARNGVGTLTPETTTLRIDPRAGVVRARVPETFRVTPAEANGLLTTYAVEVGPAGVRAELSAIGSAVRTGLAALDVPSPAADLEAWAELAALADNSETVSRTVEARVRAALDVRGFDEATACVRAADRVRVVYEHADPEDQARLKATIGLCGRASELKLREAGDDARLAEYVERPGLEKVYRELVEGDPAKVWAAHFVGHGGVGKSMLMRYIQRDVTAARKGAAARIDFDYLSPDYPAFAPALLLDYLGDELRAFAVDNATVAAFDAFAFKARSLHESLTGKDRTARPFDQLVQEEEFTGILYQFAEALSRLPRPLVLLIDTCEELDRPLPSGHKSPGVAATWAILTRLKERFGDLRVVFGGRRPLVTGEEPWFAHFRQVEVGAFDQDEADRYLAKRLPSRKDLFGAILDRCRAGAGEPGRYSPLDLSVYVTWVAADPDLTAAKIQSARVDALVEYRIVGRVTGEKVRRLIAPAVAVGRFDRPLLRAAAGLPPAPRDGTSDAWDPWLDAFTRLDWVYPQPHWFAVDAALLPRLRHYYRAADPAALTAARHRGAEHLLADAAERSPGEIDGTYLDQMLGGAPDLAERTVVAWDQLVGRLVEHGGPAALTARTSALAGLDPEGDPDETFPPPVARAVRVTLAAAHAQLRGLSDAINLWQVLGNDPALMTPETPTDVRLARRILGHRLAAWPRERRVAGVQDQQSLWNLLRNISAEELDPGLLAALVAGVEGVVERAESSDEYPALELDPDPVVRLAELGRALGPDARPAAVFAEALAGRCLLRRADRDGGRELIQQALGRVGDGRPLLRAGIDWAAPDQLSARLALERVRAGLRTGEGVRSILRALPAAVVAELDPLADIDQERLAGAVLALKAAVGRVSDRELDSRLKWFASSWEARCQAHHEFPAGFVAYAKELARRGQVAEARQAVRGHSGGAESAGTAFAVVEDADTADLWIAQRMRLGDAGAGRVGFTARSVDPAALELRRGVTALGLYPENVDLPDAPPGTSPGPHLYWRTYPASTPDRRRRALDWANAWLPRGRVGAEAPAAAWAEALDRVESERMAGLATPDPGPVPDWPTLRARGWPAAAAFRVHVRAECLLRTTSSAAQQLAEVLGERQAAEIAFGEGEFLALRLPAQGEALLRKAALWYQSGGDPLGTFLAETAAWMAAIRAGRVPAMDDLVDGYSSLASLVPALLPHGQMAAGLIPEAWPVATTPEEWVPWMARAAAVRAVARDAADGGNRWTRLSALLADADGRLPTELTGWPDATSGETVTRSYPTLVISEARQGFQRAVASVEVSIAPGQGAARTDPGGERTDPVRIDLLQPVSAWLDAIRAAVARFPASAVLQAPDLSPWGLVLGPPAAWVPWEHLLGRALLDRVPGPPVGFVREARGARRAAWQPPNEKLVCLAGSTADQGFARRGWEDPPALSSPVRDWFGAAGLDPDPSPLKVDYQVGLPTSGSPSFGGPVTVHLIGQFVEVRGGARVQLGSERFVRASELRDWFGDRAFVFLQQVPLTGQPAWTPTDVDQARLLRVFAAELHAAGATGVVTLPPLDVSAAATVLLPFRAALTHRTGFQLFAEAVELAQRSATWSGTDGLEPRESGIVFHSTGR